MQDENWYKNCTSNNIKCVGMESEDGSTCCHMGCSNAIKNVSLSSCVRVCVFARRWNFHKTNMDRCENNEISYLRKKRKKQPAGKRCVVSHTNTFTHAGWWLRLFCVLSEDVGKIKLWTVAFFVKISLIFFWWMRAFWRGGRGWFLGEFLDVFRWNLGLIMLNWTKFTKFY